MNSIEIFTHILEKTISEGYSDIHIVTESFPIIRNNSWDITQVESLMLWDTSVALRELDKKEVMEIIHHILWPSKLEVFIDTFEIDGSYQYKDNRFRINCYYDTRGFAIALRLIPKEIPKLEDLWFWEQVYSMCRKSKWLILVTGPTWVGKSTNLAWMIDYINTNFNKHIITIEDPIEFMFQNKQSLINQREVGIHTKSFANAIKSSLREDPDVIMIWEMRDPETVQAAITLAETGHLVFSTLHTNDTVQSIDRIVDIFPEGKQEQIRMQLAMSLIGIISQRLLPKKDIDDRIAAREILLNNDAVRNLIITWNTHLLYSVLETSWKHGMILLDQYLEVLYKKGLITKETLISHARDKDNIPALKEGEK